jgi:hypothetical protein
MEVMGLFHALTILDLCTICMDLKSQNQHH